MPYKRSAINRPFFSDEHIRIPRPALKRISPLYHRWKECPMCKMPQVMVDMRRGFQICECNWCKNEWKVRVTGFGRIKIEGIFQ